LDIRRKTEDEVVRFFQELASLCFPHTLRKRIFCWEIPASASANTSRAHFFVRSQNTPGFYPCRDKLASSPNLLCQ